MTRDDAIRKIRAMLRLAKARAATPGEVANALALASRLLEKFDLSMEEIESCRSEMTERTVTIHTRSVSQWNVATTTPAISPLTGTAWGMTMELDVPCRDVPIVVVGHVAAVEFATYVYTLVDRACLAAYADFRRNTGRTRERHATLWTEWVCGFGAGVSHGIETAMKAGDQARAGVNSRALIRAGDHVSAHDALARMFPIQMQHIAWTRQGDTWLRGFARGMRTPIHRAIG